MFRLILNPRTGFWLMILSAIVMGGITVIEAADPDPPPPGTSYPLYGSMGFVLLLGAFSIHLFLTTIGKRIRRRPTLFVIHLGILLIVAGAFLTWRFAIRGMIYLEEGEKDGAVYMHDAFWMVLNTSTDSTERYRIPHEKLQHTGTRTEIETRVGTLELSRFLPHAHTEYTARPADGETGIEAVTLLLTGPQGFRSLLLAEEWSEHEDVAGLGLYLGTPEPAQSEILVELVESGESIRFPVDVYDPNTVLVREGFRVELLEYYPDFKVGIPPDHSESPVNPAVRIALSPREEAPETLMVFQRFPGFSRPRNPAFGGVFFNLSPEEGYTLSLIPGDKSWRYRFTSRGHVTTGSIEEGDTILTVSGPHGEAPLIVDGLFRNAEVLPVIHPADRGPAALSVRFSASPDSFWLLEDGPEVVTGDGETDETTMYLTSRVALPFSMKLLQARREDYPNSGIPRSYRSLVSIQGDAIHGTDSVWVETNHPLSMNGWRFYQSEFGSENGSNWSGLQASYDPGAPVAATGCAVLIVGLTLIIIRPRLRWNVPAIIIAAGGIASAGQPPSIPAAGEILVRESGRIKPVSTLARELEISLGVRFPGNARDGMFAVLADPGEWLPQVTMKIKQELGDTIGLPSDGWMPAARITAKRTALQRISLEKSGSRMADHADGVLNRIDALTRIEELMALAPGISLDEAWVTPSHEYCPGWAKGLWNSIVEHYRKGDVDSVRDGCRRLVTEQRSRYAGGLPSGIQMGIERLWNEIRPIRFLGIIAATGLLLHLFGAYNRSRQWKTAGSGIVTGSFVLVLISRIIMAGRLPVLNSWEVYLLVVCIIPLLGWILSRSSDMEVIGPVSLAVALAGAIGIGFLPAEGSIIRPPVAILRSGWREIHILSTMISYAFLFLTAGLSVRILISPSDRKITETTYRLVLLGEVLLGIGIATGAAWAYDAWGRYWGWDPKEVWALVAWLLFAASLHGRTFRLFGDRGWAMMNLAGFAALLFTFFGVTYLLSGLHSYG